MGDCCARVTPSAGSCNVTKLPQGIALRVPTSAIGRQLYDHVYILPGLGDAGDRISGTQRGKTAVPGDIKPPAPNRAGRLNLSR